MLVLMFFLKIKMTYIGHKLQVLIVRLKYY